MAIHVTPIPKLTEFATPAITLGTAGSAGGAGTKTTIRSDSGIAAFNTATPDPITFGQSGAPGSANFASRIDHAHAMAASPVGDIGVKVSYDSTQSTANGALVTISFNTETYDSDTMWDAGAPTRVTFKTAGKYVVTENIAWGANSSGYRRLQLKLNGSTDLNQARFTPNASADNIFTMTTIVDADADDYVEMLVLQNSGGALTTAVYGNYSPSITAVKVVS
jgi:hypothetical protein